jgi:hypothetical protein
MLACPSCGRLAHAEQLASLAKAAREAGDRGEISTALAAWREALELLPVDSKQHQIIAAKISDLGQSLPRDAAAAEPAVRSGSSAARAATGVGVIGVTLWKFKAVLLGLTKGTTLLSICSRWASTGLLGVGSLRSDWCCRFMCMKWGT